MALKAKRPAKPAAAARRVRPRRPRRGVLTLVALLMLGSAVLRIVIHADDVMALETPLRSVMDGDPAPADQDHGASVAAAGCEPAPDVQAMLAAFQHREARLDQREAQIRDRMNALSIADEQIQTKLNQLEMAEARLRETLALSDKAAENDLAKLTAVYENMKPKDAAALFETMAPDFAAGFMGRMQPAAAAAIMAGLSSDRAYSISVILAGRNSSVPKE